MIGTYRNKKMKENKRKSTPWNKSHFHLFFILVFSLFILFGMFHTSATSQEPLDPNSQEPLDTDTYCHIITSSGKGDIELELLLYDISEDPNNPQEDQDIIRFKEGGCSALSLKDLSPIPPWGDFPYGFWRIQITCTPDFDPNIHRIIMEIFFPGKTDPLNAEYWAQTYDIDDVNVEWKEFGRGSGFFFPDVKDRSITIRISDTWIKSNINEKQQGFGDRDPNQRAIDHVGGLLWPIPTDGRCFIGHVQ
jgi:hypothetical protein